MFDEFDVPCGPKRATWDEDGLECLEGRTGTLGVPRWWAGRRGPETDDKKQHWDGSNGDLESPVVPRIVGLDGIDDPVVDGDVQRIDLLKVLRNA